RGPARRPRIPCDDLAQHGRSAQPPDGRAGHGRRDRGRRARGLLLGLRRRRRKPGWENAPGRADVGAVAERLRAAYFAAAVFGPLSFSSNCVIEIAPGTRSPFSKMIVGVPWTR